MASQKTRSSSDTARPMAVAQAGAIYADLLTLARGAGSRQAFLSRALGRIGGEFGAPYALLYARLGSEVVQEEHHQGATDPAFWRESVQQFLNGALAAGEPRARLLNARGAQYRVALLFMPLRSDPNGLDGGLTLVIPADLDQARRALQRLEHIIAVVVAALGGTVGTATRDAGGLPSHAIGRAASVESLHELAFAITNGLRNRLGCEQVALGLVRGAHVRVVSISGYDDAPKRSPGVAAIRAAMEECLDAGESIVCQRQRDWNASPIRYQLHERWRAAAAGDAVVSIPLRSSGACVAILSLRRRDDEPLKHDQLDEIRKLAEPFAPALPLVRLARRGVAQHAVDALRDSVAATVQPGRWGRKLFAALAVTTVAWFLFGTLNYAVRVPAKVAPVEARHVAMPFEGTLAAVQALPGDVVHAGDVLIELDRRDLDLEHARLLAQRAVNDQERTRALAENSPASARLAEANLRLAETQLAIVERRLELAVIRAPFDGLVIRGDLRKQVGDVLPLGAPLLEVAPLGDWLLELELPDNVAGNVAAGQVGQFAPAARPEDTQPLVVARLSPSAEVRAGRNTFVAEARLESRADWVRPGIEGVARVEVGPRRVWWIACHRILDALRLNFWL